MLFENGAAHLRMRRLVDRAFTAVRVDAMRPAVCSWVRLLVDELVDHSGPVDFISEFAYRLPVNVICDILGVPPADRGGFREPVARLARALDPGWVHLDLRHADAAADELSTYFLDLVRERRARPRDDLLSDMVRLADAAAEPMSDNVLVANAVLMLLAGFETSVGLLGNGVATLAQAPRVHDRLRGDSSSVRSFLDETLRHDTPVQFTGRRAGCDVDLAGVHVPEAGLVVVALGAAHHDPRRFDSPGDFRLDRTGPPPLSFGSGRHFCVGARLARLEAEVAFTEIIWRFARIEPAGPAEYLGRNNLRTLASLPVVLSPG